jgi:hypothetical protein
VDARRRSPAPPTPGRTNPHSLERPLAPTMRRTPNANIRVEHPFPPQLGFRPIVDAAGRARAVISAITDGGLMEWERLWR